MCQTKLNWFELDQISPKWTEQTKLDRNGQNSMMWTEMDRIYKSGLKWIEVDQIRLNRLNELKQTKMDRGD